MFNSSRITKYPDDKPQSSQHSPSMAPRQRDTPLEPSPAASILGNPNAREVQTTTATMTSPPATIKSAASVRARCNLIGKMINDVSKTLRTATDIAGSELPAALSDVVVNFPANTSTTDASNMINIKFPTPLIMKRARQERESKLTTRVTSPMPTTQAGKTRQGGYGGAILKQQQQHRPQKPASSAKSKSTENKCSAKELTTVSYQRELEPNRTFNRLALETEIHLILPVTTSSDKKHKTNVEDIKVAQKQQLRLAERNKKLKSEFLSNNIPDIAATGLDYRSHHHITSPPNTQLRSRSLKSSSTISAARAESPVAEKQVLKAPKLTLVAQRTLELKRQFEQQQQSNIATATTIDCQISNTPHRQHFPSVRQLRLRFDSKMIVNPNKLPDTASPEPRTSNLLALKRNALEQRHSPLSDEGCNLGQSPYSSDDDNDNVSIRTASTTVERKRKDKVARSASSDSALGLEVDVDDAMDAVAEAPSTQQQQQQQRRMTLTVTDLPLRPALLPLAEPTALPDSPTNELQSNMLTQTAVPSKVLLEERVVEIPEDPRAACSLSSSRRESAQSCLSDYPISECGGVRFVRTPSVVVSDYSDDVMCGITLEEIEYFRAQRMRRRRSSLDTTSGTEKDVADGGPHSDVSASSSCSNLYYCGSTISALDGAECYVNGMRMPLATERKASACSTCSASGGEDDDAVFSIPEQPEESGQLGKDLADLLAAQHLNTKRPKKPSGWRKIRNIVQWTPFFQTYKKQRYPWVQLAGHQGNFKAGPEQGTVLKKLCPKEEDCFQVLMKDVLRPYVPEYKGQVTSEDGEFYLQLQDLLSDFYQPCVMDCKIGVRTYLEEELSKAKEKPKLRKDMYEKMIQIDPDAPNEEEHKAKGVTKPRYMVWRETISSTATLGFRIEGIKRSDGTSSKDFKTTKSREQIKQAFREFINGSQHALPRYIQRMRAIRATLECSDFFRSHEVIGSSLLFVHDRTHASVWLIDFAKTVSLPVNHQIDHNTTWKVGNHEDGYLIGINNLIELFNELNAEMTASAGAASNELTVSTPSSSNSSSTSLSPMRSVSESNIDEAGAAGGADKEIKKTQTEGEEFSSKEGSSQESIKEIKSKEETREKDEMEKMEKTLPEHQQQQRELQEVEIEKF